MKLSLPSVGGGVRALGETMAPPAITGLALPPVTEPRSLADAQGTYVVADEWSRKARALGRAYGFAAVVIGVGTVVSIKLLSKK